MGVIGGFPRCVRFEREASTFQSPGESIHFHPPPIFNSLEACGTIWTFSGY